MKKECVSCGRFREERHFHRNPAMTSGRVNQCKQCSADRQRRNRERQQSLDPISELMMRWGR